MSQIILSIILDGTLMVMLGAMIYYAFRLSKSLNEFRAFRGEFDGLMRRLAKNIEEAQIAIDRLQKGSHSVGQNLQSKIDNAQALLEELQLMNEASNSLAKRLENAAENSRRAASGEGHVSPPFQKPGKPMSQERVSRPFAIRDPEFEGDSLEVPEEYPGDDGVPEHLQSQAERELFQALRKNKKSAG